MDQSDAGSPTCRWWWPGGASARAPLPAASAALTTASVQDIQWDMRSMEYTRRSPKDALRPRLQPKGSTRSLSPYLATPPLENSSILPPNV
eukprot:9199415-Pyramimonas_sp.AAC.1